MFVTFQPREVGLFSQVWDLDVSVHLHFMNDSYGHMHVCTLCRSDVCLYVCVHVITVEEVVSMSGHVCVCTGVPQSSKNEVL